MRQTVNDGPVLITGAAGQLGSDLRAALGETRPVTALAHRDLDITDEGAVAAAMDAVGPAVVVNCAAFHNVDLCEREAASAFAVNATAVAGLARRCAEHDATLVHLSTNYVFDGRRPEPYSEGDLPRPRSTYAISKLAGEYAALAYAGRALVVRSAGLYGLQGNASKGGNFVERVLSRTREQGSLRMVADQRLTPTFTADLAPALLDALGAGATGLMHLTNEGACSWLEFTEAILANAGVDAEIEPVVTAPAPGVADRPLNGVLECRAARAAGLAPLRPWREALDDYRARAGLAAAPSPR